MWVENTMGMRWAVVLAGLHIRASRRRFPTPTEARLAIFEFIEGWYNPHRRHSALDYKSPINYERRHEAVA